MKNKLARVFPVFEHINIPNAITTMGLAFGIATCYFLTQADLRMAVICLFFAGVMDAVDGFAATKLNQQSKFGGHVDTLVDFFTCCIIPVWMVFDLFGFVPSLVVGLVFYSTCGLWRLAYYNITEGTKYFTGLPVPGSMMFITIAVWCVHVYGAPEWLLAVAFFCVGTLMISGFKLPKYGLWQKVMGFSGLAFLMLIIFEPWLQLGN